MVSTEALQESAQLLSLMLIFPAVVVAAAQTAIAGPTLPLMADQAVAATLGTLAGILFLDKEMLVALESEYLPAVAAMNRSVAEAAVLEQPEQQHPAMSQAQVALERRLLSLVPP